jgi:hypothetical protein
MWIIEHKSVKKSGEVPQEKRGTSVPDILALRCCLWRIIDGFLWFPENRCSQIIIFELAVCLIVRKPYCIVPYNGKDGFTGIRST